MKLSLGMLAVLGALAYGRVAAASPGPSFDIGDASARYDFRLSLREECAPDKSPDGVCEAPGEVEIRSKGTGTPLQRIALESIDVVTAEDGQPLDRAREPDDGQATLAVGDFDFDGHEDFAVQDSQEGPYGGPTF